MTAPAPEAARAPRTSRRAGLWLLVVTMIWGASFLWTERAMDAATRVAEARGLGRGLELGAAALFVSGRFALAWVLLWLLGRLPRLAGLAAPATASLRLAGLIYAAPMLAGFALQTWALGRLDAAVSAFLTSLYVSLTALLTALVHRRLPLPATWAGVALATLGAGFIDGPPQLSFGLAAWLTVLSALVFAAGILITDHLTRRHDPLVLTRVSMGFVMWGALVWLGGTLATAAPGVVGALGTLAREPDFWSPLLLNAVLANVVALALINLFQRELEPVRAAILYSLEPVWTAVWVFVLLGRPPTGWLWLGGGALLLGNLVAELAPRRRAAARQSSR